MTIEIDINMLEANTGQIPGLPSNPRQWTKAELTKLAKSLKETPELFQLRPIIVYFRDGKYIVMGGNFRLEAAKHNKMQKVPCAVIDPDTPIAKLKEIVIKDNGSFGAWDYDQLANEWDDLPLTEWGVPAWNGDVDEMPSDLDAENNAKPFVLKITFPSAAKQTMFVMEYKNILEKDYGCIISQSGGEL